MPRCCAALAAFACSVYVAEQAMIAATDPAKKYAIVEFRIVMSPLTGWRLRRGRTLHPDRRACGIALDTARPHVLYDLVGFGRPRCWIVDDWRRRDVLIRADVLIGRPDALLHLPALGRLDVNVFVLAHQVD